MENNRINNKDLKHAGGNWGHPRPDVKKRTEVPDRPEVPKHLGLKKYKPKKEKKPWYSHCCPFCNAELPEVVSKEQARVFERHWYDKLGRSLGVGFGSRNRGLWSGIRASKCLKCGAREVYTKKCPCCKRVTWYDKKTKIYKHNGKSIGCGFVGTRKNE